MTLVSNSSAGTTPASQRRSIPDLLRPLDQLAAGSVNLIANHHARFEVNREAYTLPCYGEPVKPGPHKIQGTGAGFVQKNLNLDCGRRNHRLQRRLLRPRCVRPGPIRLERGQHAARISPSRTSDDFVAVR